MPVPFLKIPWKLFRKQSGSMSASNLTSIWQRWKVVVFTMTRSQGCARLMPSWRNLLWRLAETLPESHIGKIPLLSDVLSYVNGRVPLLIELKLPTKSTRLCHEVHKLLETYQGAYLIQSFNTIGIFWFRKNAPHILRGQLSSNLTKTRKTDLGLPVFFARFSF